MGIKSYIWFKNLFQNNFWDGIPNNRMMHSHLKTLKHNSNQIIHEGTPLDNFVNNFLREPSFTWNPPIWSTLTSVGKNDIDDQFKFDDYDNMTQNDEDNSFREADPDVGSVARNHVDEIISVNGGSPGHGNAESNRSYNLTALPEDEIIQGGVIPQSRMIPTGVSKITELTIDLFKNNDKLCCSKTS